MNKSNSAYVLCPITIPPECRHTTWLGKKNPTGASCGPVGSIEIATQGIVGTIPTVFPLSWETVPGLYLREKLSNNHTVGVDRNQDVSSTTDQVLLLINYWLTPSWFIEVALPTDNPVARLESFPRVEYSHFWAPWVGAHWISVVRRSSYKAVSDARGRFYS
jgi:hypothetical protein